MSRVLQACPNGSETRGPVALAATFLLAVTLAVAPGQAVADPPGVGFGQTSRPDATSASYEATALEIAEAYGHDVTVTSETSDDSITVAHPNGTFTTEADALPARTLVKGVWTALDPNLTASGSAVIPAVADVPTQFSPGGAGPMAQVQAASGQWLSVSWPLGSLPTPTISGSTATYADVAPGIDLDLTATADGFSEVLVIKSAAAVSQAALKNLTFTIDNGSLALTSLGNGAFQATSADGSVELNADQPTWWDSADANASAAGPGDSSVPLAVPTTVSADGKSVTLSASTIAAAQNLTYPVYVDPSWTGGRQAWDFVDSAYPSQNYLNGAGASDGFGHVGYVSASDSPQDGRSHTARTFFKMDTHAVAGKDVLSAQFNTHLYYSSSCTAEPVDLYRSVDPVSSATSWNNQPALSAREDEKSVAFRKGDSSCDGGNSSQSYLSVGFDAGGAAAYAANRDESSVTVGLVGAERI